jgi:hypothetical protein
MVCTILLGCLLGYAFFGHTVVAIDKATPNATPQQRQLQRQQRRLQRQQEERERNEQLYVKPSPLSAFGVEQLCRRTRSRDDNTEDEKEALDGKYQARRYGSLRRDAVFLFGKGKF